MVVVGFGVLGLLAIVAVVLIALLIAMFVLERHYLRIKKSVMNNKDCVSFTDKKYYYDSTIRQGPSWVAAKILQDRCAENGHYRDCPGCGRSLKCSTICHTDHGVTVRGIYDALRSISTSSSDSMFLVVNAFKVTEDIEDMCTLLTADNDAEYQRPYPTTAGLHLYNRAEKEFFLNRCRELVSERYEDMPFDIRFTFANEAVKEKLAETISTE